MVEELRTLFDLAEKEGASRDEVVTSIKAAVAAEYQKLYPEGAKEITVLVDTHGGYVRILSEDKDITPAEFAPEAARLARQVVIGYLKKEEKKPPPPPAPERKTSSLLMRLLFYGYNGLSLFYLLIFLLGLLSENFRELLQELIRQKGAYGLLLLTVLIATPIGSVYGALKYGLSWRDALLAKLLFLFEIPTVLVALFLFGAFTEPIPAIWLFSLVLLVLPLVFFLKTTEIKIKGIYEYAASFITKEVIFLATAYIALLYSFFSPLFIGMIVKGIFGLLESFFRYGTIGVGEFIPFLIFLPFALAGLLFLTFLAFLPYIVLLTTTKMFLAARQEAGKHLGEERVSSWVMVTAVVAVLVVIASAYQPNISLLLEKLQTFTDAQSFGERETIARELMPQEHRLKQAIEDARNARRRYFLLKDDDFLADAYEETFSLPPAAAGAIQDVFTMFASPFVYQGPTDINGKLSTAYEELFGKSIWEDRYAKTRAVNQVRLLSRKVEVKTDYEGLLATVSVEEEYENTTYRNEEVVYEFSLPSEATIFDLKLGPNLEHKGVIAPRGAAREVYEQELRRSRDPALLEQTGPRQYRLRVFPIPGKNDFTTLNGKNQRVKFSYVVGASRDGYPLPNYSKEQNVLRDRSTDIAYYLNGEKVMGNPQTVGPKTDPCTFTTTFSVEGTIEEFSFKLVPHLAEDRIRADYACDKRPASPAGGEDVKLLANIKNKRIALLYDVSYQNKRNKFPQQLEDLLVDNRGFLTANKIDLYLFNDRLSSATTLSEDTFKDDLDLVYFGKSDLAKTLSAFNGAYDLAVIVAYSDKDTVLTPKNLPQARFPVYLLHTNKAIPAYNIGLTNHVLQSGGQVTDSFIEAVNHFEITQRLQRLPRLKQLPLPPANESGQIPPPPRIELEPGEEEILFVGPYWSLRSESQVLASFIPTPTPTPFRPTLSPLLTPTPVQQVFTDLTGDLPRRQAGTLGSLAARAYLLNELASYTGNIEQDKAFLDQLNRLAEESNVVTPYSSLIALVTAEQRERLEREKGQLDRYEAQTEEIMRMRPPTILPGMGFGMGSFFGVETFGGSKMMRIPATDEFGAAPGGVAMMDGGGGIGLPFVMPLIAISGLLAAGGVTVFALWRAKSYLTRRKNK